MTEETFYKCACPACGGHIEFPAAYVGDKIPCPHCLAEVVLVTSVRWKTRPWVWVGLAVLALAAAAFLLSTARLKTGTTPTPSPNPSAENERAVPSPPPSINETELPEADLAVLRYELKKAQEGGLQFVVGIITNRSAAQYFSLKVEFDLFKADGQPAGTAADLLSDLAPHAVADFRATVLEKAVTKVKLVKVSGEKE